MHAIPANPGESPRPDAVDAPLPNPWNAADVLDILREEAWHSSAPSPAISAWCAEAAALLGPQGQDREALRGLLARVFGYNAAAILSDRGVQSVLARDPSRGVLRLLARLVLAGPALDSNRFKEIVTALKAQVTSRGRELFWTLRLALAGAAGEGELDRVILLLDSAAALPFDTPVKGSKQRILEFCCTLD